MQYFWFGHLVALSSDSDGLDRMAHMWFPPLGALSFRSFNLLSAVGHIAFERNSLAQK